MRPAVITRSSGAGGKGHPVKSRKTRTANGKATTAATARKAPAAAKIPDETALLTLTEAAFRLGRVHRTTIMRWVKEGRLRCVRLSRKAILFETDEIDRFIREHRYSGH